MEQAISLGGFDPIQACVRSSGTSDTGKRLACQSCQRRKVKCDRDLPCLACRKNGLQCIAVVNQRLPRGLSGGRRKAGGDLANRIGKLESLIKSAQHLGQLPLATSSCNSSNKEQPAEPDDAVPCSQYQYLGSAFWTSLQDELRNLETELNSSDIDGSVDDLAEDAHTPAESSNGDSPLPFDPVFGIISSPVLLQHPLPLLKVHLCSVYFQNIDPVFKVLHAPSVRSHVELGVPYLSYSDDDSAVAALEFVMYYAAVTTMTDVECETTLWQTKRQALRQFRIMAEAALVQAEYIITTDITTLQAFVIYLVCVPLRRHCPGVSLLSVLTPPDRLFSVMKIAHVGHGRWQLLQRASHLRWGCRITRPVTTSSTLSNGVEFGTRSVSWICSSRST